MLTCNDQNTVQVVQGREGSQGCDENEVLLDQQGLLQERKLTASTQFSWHGMFLNIPDTSTIHCKSVRTPQPDHRSLLAHLGCSVMNIIPSIPAITPAQNETNIMSCVGNHTFDI